jgi:hypothetical protein
MGGSAQPLTILNYAELATFLCVEADRPDRGPKLSACAPVSSVPSRIASLRSASRRSAWLRSARCRFAP